MWNKVKAFFGARSRPEGLTQGKVQGEASGLDDPDEPTLRLLHLLLHTAFVRDRADKLLFGPPADELPRRGLTAVPEVDDPALRLIGDVLGTDGKTPCRSARIHGRHIPIWHRIDGIWHEREGFPAVLFPSMLFLLDNSFEHWIDGAPSDKPFVTVHARRGSPERLFLQLDLEENLCYSILKL